ncbi:MAG: peptide chain release factor N(5)-glutamine methyltransferase [Erysipelotrichaceae bacterium]|nr:peptide chain release factor N(5)-glutamine methyltransferase [Erysipelotrichaceae bacterium]
MPSYREVLNKTIRNISNTDISDEAVRILMLELCNMSSADLYLHYEDEIDQDILDKFNDGVERLLKNEPLQYILGYQWFYGNKIIVNEEVLIPRYETEELVANVLADSDYFFKDKEEIVIADVGTGSGAIAVSLAKEEPKFRMYATDISETALEVARQNAELNGVNITFYQGDMLEPLIEKNLKLDILVSNPPYIPVEQEVQKSVGEYEPHVALFGGNDGLYFYRKIFEKAYQLIKEHSFMAFEIGFDEKDALLQLAKEYFPNDRYDVLKDLNGKNRMLFIYHNLEE